MWMKVEEFPTKMKSSTVRPGCVGKHASRLFLDYQFPTVNTRWQRGRLAFLDKERLTTNGRE